MKLMKLIDSLFKYINIFKQNKIKPYNLTFVGRLLLNQRFLTPKAIFKVDILHTLVKKDKRYDYEM